MALVDAKENSGMNQDVRQVQKWKCDVCRIRTFSSLDDANAHEEECRKAFQPAVDASTTSSEKESKPIEQVTAQVSKQIPSNPAKSNRKAAKVTPPPPSRPKSTQDKIKGWLTAKRPSKNPLGVKKTPLSTLEPKTAEESTPLRTAGDASKSKTDLPPPREPLDTRRTSSRPKRPVQMVTLQPPKDESSKEPKKRAKAKPKASSSSKRTAASVSTPSFFQSKKPKTNQKIIDLSKSSEKKPKPALASIFLSKKTKANKKETAQLAAVLGVDPQELLEQQRAAQFQAERRRLERQEKQKEHAVHVQQKRVLRRALNQKGCAPRFPVPNHVVPTAAVSDTGDTAVLQKNAIDSHEWFSETRKEEMNRAWRSNVDPSSISGDESLFYKPKLLPNSKSLWAQRAEPENRLQGLLARSLEVIPSEAPSADVWADYFRLEPNRICGGETQQEYQSLLEWVEQWKASRLRSIQHMEAKQRELRRSHKKQPKKKQKTVYKDDDDLWSDSEEENCGLSALCVVSGPVGCGKTSLVHAVAKQAGCKLLELNTTDKRGASALKKAIGEATQSLANIQAKQATKSFFGVASDLVDSEDEKEQTADDVALTAILIDEVDILYEENGDNGFWPALLELSRRAKCPIFLTAHSLPVPLRSVCMSFKYVELERPSSAECAKWLRHMIECLPGGLKVRGQVDTDLREAMSLCNCDLRKILHEVRLFSLIPSSEKAYPPSPKVSLPQAVDRIETQFSGVQVYSIQPHPAACAEYYTVLCIIGSGFSQLATDNLGLGYAVNVFVGDQICPLARILNDATIYAVCPPDVSGADYYNSPSRRFARVRVAGTNALGMLTESGQAVQTNRFFDGTLFASMPMSVNVERYYSQPGVPSHQAGFGNDYGQGSNWGNPTPSTSNIDYRLCLHMLKTQIDSWCTLFQIQPQPSFSDVQQDGSKGLKEIEEAYAQLELESDAALLEDIGDSLPVLAGSVRGFGFDFADDAFPGCTNEKNKPPGEDVLYELNLKDDSAFFLGADAFVTTPRTARERKLLRNTERYSRGFAFQESCVPTDEDDDEFVRVELPEDQCLLPLQTTQAFCDLPRYLRERGNRQLQSREVLQSQDGDRKLDKSHVYSALSDYLFASTPLQPRLFFTGMHRILDPLVECSYDDRLWLDYLPLLRTMAVLDRAAGAAFEATSNPELAGVPSNRRRSTRQSKKAGYGYYLEALAPPVVWQNEDGSVSRVLSTIADGYMQYYR